MAKASPTHVVLPKGVLATEFIQIISHMLPKELSLGVSFAQQIWDNHSHHKCNAVMRFVTIFFDDEDAIC